jgi:hypothetical protein
LELKPEKKYHVKYHDTSYDTFSTEQNRGYGKKSTNPYMETLQS